MKRILSLGSAMSLFGLMAMAQVPVTGTGDGLKGEYWSGSSNFDQPIPDYYRDTDFHTSPQQDEGGTYEFSRVDPTVNFDWGSGNPFNETTDDMSFSIKWTGYLLAPVTGEYTFDLTYCDDAFSLKLWDADDVDAGTVAEYADEYIGGPNLGWNWDKDFWLVPGSLEEGKFYQVELLYFENAGGSHINLKWFIDEYSTGSETIPQAQLYSERPAAGVAASVGGKLGISSRKGQLCLSSATAEAVEIYSASGARVASLNVCGRSSLPLGKGVYVVRHGSKAEKVILN